MPLSNSAAPTPIESANLDLVAPMNPRTTKLLMVVMWHKNRVHLRVEEISSEGEVLQDRHSRMGLVLWRTLALPSFLMYAESLGLSVEVREVVNSNRRSS